MGTLNTALEIAKDKGYSVISQGLVITTIIVNPKKYSLTHPTVVKAIEEQTDFIKKLEQLEQLQSKGF